MKTMVSELLQYGITRDDLEKLAEETVDHPILSAKLKDLCVFYEAF